MTMKSYGLLAIVVCIFSVSMFQSMRDIQSGQSTAIEVTALNYWNVSQARFELDRTIAALDAYMSGLRDLTKEDLLARIDIFWSRLPILFEGDQSSGLVELTNVKATASQIISRLEEMEADILTLEPDDQRTYAKLRSTFLSFERPLQDLLLQVHHAHDTGNSSLHEQLEYLYTKHATSMIGALMSGAVLILFLLRSIRKAQLAHRSVHDARAELETMINALPLSIDAVDREGRLTLLNDYARKALGGDAEQGLGRPKSEIGLAQVMADLDQQVLVTGRPIPATEISIDLKGDTSRTWLVSKVPVKEQGGVVRKVITVGVDITDRKQAEARIQYMAHHDVLTGLPNRAYFHDRLTLALDACGCVGARLALFCIDFDRFKDVNDRLGHEAGDRFLVEASRRLARCLPTTATIARLGGDEFAVIQEGIADATDARRLATRLTTAFKKPIDLGGQHWFSTISLGISLSTGAGTDPERLLRHADLALYDAKALGGNTHCFFAPEMIDRQLYHHGIQQDLRSAIAQRQLTLHYQPKVRLSDHKLSGCEALLRWNHPQHGAIAPSVFIPAAENCDLIMAIGRLVLREVCAQIVAWQNEGFHPPPIAINMSAAQFMREDVVALMRQALDETGISPHSLEVEVTESILMDNSESVLETLRTLRSMAIGITLDDFGTGYSSLNYLQRFPINKIKIDKSFVQPIVRAQDDLAIIRAIIAMAHSLDITVVAEGVETEAQCNMLAKLGCDEIQGFLIGRANPPEKLADWLCLGTAMWPVGLPSNRPHGVVPLYPSSQAGSR